MTVGNQISQWNIVIMGSVIGDKSGIKNFLSMAQSQDFRFKAKWNGGKCFILLWQRAKNLLSVVHEV